MPRFGCKVDTSQSISSSGSSETRVGYFPFLLSPFLMCILFGPEECPKFQEILAISTWQQRNELVDLINMIGRLSIIV